LCDLKPLRHIYAGFHRVAAQAVKTPAQNDLELVRAIDAFAAEPNGAVLVLSTTPNIPLVK